MIDVASASAHSVPAGSSPAGLALSPDGSTLYVTDNGGNAVSVIDTTTGTITATIPVGVRPIGVAITPGGGTVFVANAGGNSVSVIDSATATVTSTATGFSAPRALALRVLPTPLPAVTGISPNHGPEAGGTTVTITGTGLSGATALSFGSSAATSFTVNSDTSITAVAPPGADGTVEVTVTTPGGTSATGIGDRYTYDEPAPAVTTLTPTSGPLAGGTTVTITGTDFLGATAVTFGATAASAFTVNSDTQITATAPAAQAVGPVDVTITTAAGTSIATAADRYTYAYPFTGFYAPVATSPVLNEVHAGQGIPIKFSLGGDHGLNIIPTGYPTATQVDCATGAPVNTGTLTDTAGGSGLQYDPPTNTYTYVWKTLKSWAGTCQIFALGLSDSTTHTADFHFVN